jgi:hypothetical protein
MATKTFTIGQATFETSTHCACGDVKPAACDECDVCNALSEAAVEIENMDGERNLVAQRCRNVLNMRRAREQ